MTTDHKPFLIKDRQTDMICAPIMAQNNYEALIKLAEAEEALADMIEIRLDVMETFDLEEIIRAASKPIMVTYRSKGQGGEGSADYGTRISYLINAIEAGADFVDVEFSLPSEFRHELFQVQGASRLIISNHLLNGTPSREKLEGTLRKMAATGADIVKIITQAGTPQDNLRVLNLIPLAKNLGIKIIAFCMGHMGRISRIASPLMGGYLTFASLETGEESASGQISIMEIKKILDIISS
jgi:3-dehydroquinate dehydratase type I